MTTHMNALVREVGAYIEENFEPDEYLKFQLGLSGGKDSTCCYLLLLELGIEFTPTFADTGNEHPDTVEHAMNLAAKTGGPEVTYVQKTFTEADFKVRRDNLIQKWSKPHRIQAGPRRGEMMPPFPQHVIDDALSVLHPTGNNFLDMVLLHGMFPQRRSQFCTLELKIEPMKQAIIDPWVEGGFDVICANGVRADESTKRSDYPRHKVDLYYESTQSDVLIFHPILDWKAEDCFEMHARHCIEPNPLYRKGMARVGCMPCIHATQPELVEIYKRFPEQLERIKEWEQLTAKVSRWARFHDEDATLFIGPRSFGGSGREIFHTTVEYVQWVGDNKPKHDLEADAPACSSVYGLCE